MSNFLFGIETTIEQDGKEAMQQNYTGVWQSEQVW